MSISRVKNLEIVEHRSNTVVSVSQTQVGISAYRIALNISAVKIRKIGVEKFDQVISGGYISVDLRRFVQSLFVNIASPIFEIRIDDIDILAIARLMKSGENLEKQPKLSRKVMLNNMIAFFKKKYLGKFNLILTFKYEPIAKMPNLTSLEVKTCNKAKCLAEMKIGYSAKGKSGEVHAVVTPQKEQDKKRYNWKLIPFNEKNDYSKVAVEVYGYANDITFQAPKFSLLFDGFFNAFASYDLDNDEIQFRGTLDEGSFISDRTSDISSKKISLNGLYKAREEYLEIAKVDLQLIDGAQTVNFTGGFKLTNRSLMEIAVQSPDRFGKDLVFRYWPQNSATKLRTALNNTLLQGDIVSPNFYIKTLIQKDNPLLKLSTKFSLHDAVMEQNTGDKKYTIQTPSVDVAMNEQGAVIKSDSILINDILPVQNILIDIPFKQQSRSSIKFNVDANGHELNKISRDLNMKFNFVPQGRVDISSHIQIPHQPKVTWQDMMFDFESKLRDIKVQYKNVQHKVNANRLKVALTRGNLQLKGDLSYNDIDIKSLNFSGTVGKSGITSWSAHLEVPANQGKIQEITTAIQTRLEGRANVTANGNPKLSRVSVDARDLTIENPVLMIDKEIGEDGEISFTIADEQIEEIMISLPDIIATGSVSLSNKNVTNADFAFEKFHNNKFNFSYKSNDSTSHEYRITADVIDADEINRILANNKIHKNEKTKSSKDRHAIHIDVKDLQLKSKPIISNLQTELVFEDGKLKKIDGSAYGIKNNAYVRVFLDTPVLALIVNNMGQIINDSVKSKSLRRGNLYLYGNINDMEQVSFDGDLYMKNFTLMESFLLSTILRVFSLSGRNIFSVLENGVRFYDSHCGIHLENDVLQLKNCRALGDSLLMGGDMEFNFKEKSGRVEGNIIPKSFFNTPVIAFYRLFTRRGGGTILDTFEGRQNFAIIWMPDHKPIIQTNPVSFMLPSVFSYFLSKRKEKKVVDVKHETPDKVSHSSH